MAIESSLAPADGAVPRPVLAQAPAPELPRVALPRAPEPALIWTRSLRAASILNLIFTLDQLTVLLANFWLLESLHLESVFWTNFRMGARLWAIGFVTVLAAFVLPALAHPLERRQRRIAIELGVLAASVAGYLLCVRYGSFLLSGSVGVPFGKTDPVFGHDLGFYVYNLDNIWIVWHLLFWASLAAVVLSVVYALRTRSLEARAELTRLERFLADAGTLSTQIALAVWGLVAAAGMWLTRYDLLFKDNRDSSVWTGAEALDVTGVLSNLNYIYLTTTLMMVDDIALIAVLVVLRNMHRRRQAPGAVRPLRALAITWAALLVLDFGFKVLVEVRNWTAIKPNEPVVQLPFIQRNLEATRAAFHLDDVEEIEYRPKGPSDPPADVERLLQSETLRQAPLWPGFSSYLERHLDIQHANRVFLTDGDPMIYGPTLEAFRQQQQLRTYYDFIGVDAVRYRIDGRKQMFVSAVREAPLMEPSPWLAYWGQRFMLFTHGFGLVMAPMSSADSEGAPDYASWNIPTQVRHQELAVENPRVYYGEGSATMAFSNVDQMKELDYPTDQGRAEIFLPEDVDAGVRIDSLWKRLVFGWRSDRFFEILWSDLIEDGTRIHFYRTPLERLGQVAPFLYVDPNVYAVAAGGGIQWLANGMTTSIRYPYSWPAELGDKSDHRSPFPKEERMVSYVEDSVKATMDAFTGQIRLYAVSDEPLISTYRKIYPELFAPGDQMPEALRQQITYPLHLFHTQFDDHFIYYHMADPMYFFNMEDMWDDGDDVLGPMIDQGKAITFSIEPYNLMLETGGILPAAQERTQFATMAVFTPESALNLRAIPIAYQDGADYGRKVVLTVPKGTYVPSPEQADAAIDQDPRISQLFAWWTRRGMEVVRGHTTLLPVEDEVIYVEPIFLRSRQLQVTQLKKVAVVYRGKPVMRDTLEEALRAAVAGEASSEEVPRDLEPGAAPETREARHDAPALEADTAATGGAR
jgi:uncharacterized membrane protein (UPF0182 family)